MTVEEICTNEELLQKLDQAKSEAEFCEILTASGASDSDIHQFVEKLRNLPEELSEDELEDVAGGCKSPLQRYIAKLGYRIKYGKWFVRTYYDDYYIYAENRFGDEKIVEKIPY